MQLTRTSNKLKRTILFNAEHGEAPFVAPEDSGYFSLVLINEGEGSINLYNRSGETVTIDVATPMAVCLRNGETMTDTLTHGDIYNIVFSPTFINVNMKTSLLDQEAYEMLAKNHYLFQLAPFMETVAELKCISMTHEQISNYLRLCDNIISALENEDPDNCWSCRIRANLMDILMGLETQYKYMIQMIQDNSLTFITYRDIVIQIHGNYPNVPCIQDICKKYGVNKNKLQKLFYRYAGVSFYSFIKQSRLERSRNYLAFTSLNITEIAFRVGFSTEQHFYRFFKGETGMAPGMFRKISVARRKNVFTKLNMDSKEDPGCYLQHI